MDLVEYLEDKKEDIESLKVLPRELEPQLSKQYILTLIGPRRAGKSFFIYHLIRNKLKLERSQYLYANLEDPQLPTHSLIFHDLIKAHIRLYGKHPKYVFFDEVQAVPGWEKAITSLYERQKYYLVITGSNAQLSGREVATQLRGRSLTQLILPLSFSEFLTFRYGEKLHKPISSYQKARLEARFREYLALGGFPQVVLYPESKAAFYSDYLDIVLYKDVIERYKVKNLAVLKYMIKTMLGSVARPFSINKLYKDLKFQGLEVSKKTLYNYYQYILNSLVFYEVKKWYPSLKSREKSLPKIYLADHGFLENGGKAFENVVFLELLRHGKKVYYMANGSYEVDFYIPPATHIQATWNLEEAQSRELRALEKVKGRKCIVVPYFTEEAVSFLEMGKCVKE